MLDLREDTRYWKLPTITTIHGLATPKYGGGDGNRGMDRIVFLRFSQDGNLLAFAYDKSDLSSPYEITKIDPKHSLRIATHGGSGSNTQLGRGKGGDGGDIQLVVLDAKAKAYVERATLNGNGLKLHDKTGANLIYEHMGGNGDYVRRTNYQYPPGKSGSISFFDASIMSSESKKILNRHYIRRTDLKFNEILRAHE